MIALLSWVLVFCVALYFAGIMIVVFISPSLIPVIVGISIVLGAICSVVLLTLLVRERMHDREAEKDDLIKY